MEASALQAPSGVGRFRGSVSTPFLRLRSDEQLVELFRAGHEDAFRVIHDRYRARLFAYTRQMLPNSRPDAEDALQDVFIRAYSGLRANNRDLALRAWLYRVAHNRCVDQLRRNMPILTDEIEVTSRDVSTDPMAAVEQREDLRKLVADVQRLPDQQRSALLLREMSGMSYQELADSMELSVPAIKSLLVRARTGLNAAAEARNTDCASIRAEIVESHDQGSRPSALTRRHLHDCATCQQYRESVRGVSKSLAALIPAGPLVLGLKLLGIGSAYSAAAYSGSAGAGAAAGGAAAGGAAAGGAGAAVAGGAAAAAGGAAAGGAAVGGAAAGSAIVGGVSASHIAAIIAAAAAAGGAVAVTHHASTPHSGVATVHPAASVISKAVHRAVANGYSPAAAVAPVAPIAAAAGTATPAAPSSTPAVSALRHSGATAGGAGTATSAGASAKTPTTTAASPTTSTTPAGTTVSTTASAVSPTTTTASPAGTSTGATSSSATSSTAAAATPGATSSTTAASGAPTSSTGDSSATTAARTDSTAQSSANTPSTSTPSTASATTSPSTTSGSTDGTDGTDATDGTDTTAASPQTAAQ
jgi:RNA polymerase sigma factor (sigma-70 family)